MQESTILNKESLKYTMLPFLNTLTAAKIFYVIGALMLIYLIVRIVIFKRSLSLHRAPTSVAFAYVITSLANCFISVFFYWYWALPLCAVLSVIFMFTTAGEVKDANTDERVGVWGLNGDIRRIRSELFNDMPPEQQLEYTAKVKPYNFNRWLFVAVTLIVPAAFVLACKLAGLGYLFFPVEI